MAPAFKTYDGACLGLLLATGLADTAFDFGGFAAWLAEPANTKGVETSAMVRTARRINERMDTHLSVGWAVGQLGCRFSCPRGLRATPKEPIDRHRSWQ